MSTNRLEAFSDGVFAIAITLLVLDIHVPAPGSGELGHELLAQWPSYAAYIISFITIGIIWINHHAAFSRLRAVDHSILIWNLLLREPIPAASARRTLRFAALGQVPYLLATGLAFLSPYITLGICAACAVYYALPVASRAGEGARSGAGTA